MRLQEKEPENAYMEREADLLEKNEGHDKREEQEEGERDGCCRLRRVNGEDRVVEQLV